MPHDMTHMCEEPPQSRAGRMPPITHLPRGASLSPKGDLGAWRAMEVRAAFRRPIKNAGQSGKCARHF